MESTVKVIHMVNPEQLYELLIEVEKLDPLNFDGLPFDAEDLRKLVCLNVVELMEGWAQLAPEDRELIMSATMVRLMLENLVLNARVCLITQEGE
ncbi:MAG TPA: hypothetical protein VFF75_06345 [Methylophilaceae bacterium]|nr:hypothetical protein [Methylophilaceae bacterium]